MQNNTEDWLSSLLDGIYGGHSVLERHIERAEAAQAITQRIEEAYRKGYNDNARDCTCDDVSYAGFTTKVPHHHLMDDGKSHDIRPNITTTKFTKVQGKPLFVVSGQDEITTLDGTKIEFKPASEGESK